MRPMLKSVGVYAVAHRLYFFIISVIRAIQNHFCRIFKKTAPILLYHRVVNLTTDPIRLAVTPACFEQHLIFLKKHYDIVSLSELSKRSITGTLKGNEASITFDDGYKDNLANALPLLEKYNVPAAIFITTAYLGKVARFEWDMEYSESDRAVFLNAEEIQQLSRHPLITIGTHTENHVRLANLSPERQKEEILKSKASLESITGTKVKHFAYPFGGKYDFNTVSQNIVDGLGFEFAYSNIGVLSVQGENRTSIPRINIRQCSPAKLARQILTHSFLAHIVSTFRSTLGYFKIDTFAAKAYRYSYSLLITPFERQVSRKDFKDIHTEMKQVYLSRRDSYDFKEFIVPQWHKNMLDIEEYFLNKFTFSFLNRQVIKLTMFMYTFKCWKNIQKNLISTCVPTKKARQLLREYNIGKPLLNDAEYVTSGNSIHHLYHLLKFFKETNTLITDLNTVVEVGGGYGNLAKIYMKMRQQNKISANKDEHMSEESTYIIIDIPIFSHIQAVYLKTIFGRSAVHIADGNNLEIKKGLINLIPLDKNTFPNVQSQIKEVDLFVSTWALSESNEAMQNYIKSVDYFKATYLLLAYQKSVDRFAFAEDIQNTTATYTKIFNEETEYVRDNYYLFCKREIQ